MNIHRSKQATGRKPAGIHAVCVIGCLLLGQACYGQSYIFESPNTREHMSGEAAAQSLDSYEQRQ
ncbi:MAG: hypothetical protein LAP21_23450 [Acidobacteriia bacterium]|nr:hypothetical protein [Terriglobia bacterium]